MNDNALKKQIALLEQIIELQKQLIAAKGMAYPVVYYPYIQQPLYDPWSPWKPHPFHPQWTYTSGGTATLSDITYTT